MRKDTTPRDMLLDRRVVDRNIRKGLLTREEYEKSLGGLPDVSEQAEEIRARLGVEDTPEPVNAAGADLDDDEDDEDTNDDGDGDESGTEQSP